MTIQIRRGVFETNSSSSHSLTIVEGNLVEQPFSKEVLREGVLILPKGDFWNDWYRYYKSENKIRYLLTQFLRSDIPEGDAEEVTRDLRDANTSFNQLCETIYEFTGVTLLVEPGSSGCIDHQSEDVGCGLVHNPAQLRAFLFGGSSYVQTGSDNTKPGKIIQTDIGPQHYYEKWYRAVAPEALKSLILVGDGNYDNLCTASGATLSEEVNPELYEQLKQQGTVTSLSTEARDWCEPFDKHNLDGSVMSMLSRNGFFFDQNLRVDMDFNEIRGTGKECYQKDRYVFQVPHALASQIEALKPLKGR